jgi:hypothetical protein
MARRGRRTPIPPVSSSSGKLDVSPQSEEDESEDEAYPNVYIIQDCFLKTMVVKKWIRCQRC